MDDRMILALYNRRDEQAIAETSRKYGEYCFTVANRILADEQDSEECVNDTWLRAWNAIPPAMPGCLRLFLAKITRNLAFDRYKAANRQKRGDGELTIALEELSECLPDGSSVELQVEEKELVRSINRFLRSIGERECNLFVRRYFYAEPVKDIALRFGLKEGNVQKILSRTRVKLRNYLESEGYAV